MKKKQVLDNKGKQKKLSRRSVDHSQVIVLHRRHAEDLVRVHPRAHDAEPDLCARGDSRSLIRSHKRRLSPSSSAASSRSGASGSPSPAAAELVLVRDQVVGDKHLHGARVREEADLRDRGHDGVEDFSPRRPEHQAAVAERKSGRAGASVADRALADGLDARDADDEAVFPGAGALNLGVFFLKVWGWKEREG